MGKKKIPNVNLKEPKEMPVESRKGYSFIWSLCLRVLSQSSQHTEITALLRQNMHFQISKSQVTVSALCKSELTVVISSNMQMQACRHAGETTN